MLQVNDRGMKERRIGKKLTLGMGYIILMYHQRGYASAFRARVTRIRHISRAAGNHAPRIKAQHTFCMAR